MTSVIKKMKTEKRKPSTASMGFSGIKVRGRYISHYVRIDARKRGAQKLCIIARTLMEDVLRFGSVVLTDRDGLVL